MAQENIVEEFLDTRADREPDRLALWYVKDNGQEVKLSYKEILDKSKQYAHMLSDRCGLGPGDVVIVMSDRNIEWCPAVLAIFRVGAVLVPAPAISNPRQITYKLASAKPKLLLASTNAAREIQQLPESSLVGVKWKVLLNAEDTQIPGWLDLQATSMEFSPEFRSPPCMSGDAHAAYFFTSGSSGYPKLVVHTHDSFFNGYPEIDKYWNDLRPGDILWIVADMAWMMTTLLAVVELFRSGASLFLHELGEKELDSAASFDSCLNVNHCLQVLTDYPITVFHPPPSGYQVMVRQDLSKFQPAALRRCLSCGQLVPLQVLRKWREEIGVPISEGYGQSEGGTVIANIPGQHKEGSMGVNASPSTLHIVDESLSEVAVGEVGQLAVKVKPDRPASLFLEYLNDPKRTASVFQGDYYLTGDEMYLDEEGFYHFVGRQDDIIKSYMGARVGPVEVEDALSEHRAVLESAVIGSPCDDDGTYEVVKAVVVLKNGFEGGEGLVEDLKKCVLSILAEQRKCPQKIEFVTSLPKTAMGKVNRRAMREEEWKQVNSK